MEQPRWIEPPDLCEVDVRWKTVAFKKIKFSTRENVGFGSVDIPAQKSADDRLCAVTRRRSARGRQSARLTTSRRPCGIRNLAVVALPMVAMCDSRDHQRRGRQQELRRTTMILYDRYPGGLGYAEKGYDLIVQLLRICLRHGGRLRLRGRLPQLRGLAQPATGDSQRSRFAAGLPDPE